MRYEEHPPDDAFQDHIECFWSFTTDADDPDSIEHVIVPDGAVSISCIILPDGMHLAGLVGPSRHAHHVPLTKGGIYCGIRFRPGRAGSIFNCDIQSVNGFNPLAEISLATANTIDAATRSTASVDDLRLALHGAVQTIIDAAAPLDAPVCAFADAIMKAQGRLTLAEAIATLPLGERQLRRRFLLQTGITPKEFARLRRVRQACARLVMEHSEQLNEASLEAGFADQAHMAREFKEVFGASTRMIISYLRQINHEHLVTSQQ